MSHAMHISTLSEVCKTKKQCKACLIHRQIIWIKVLLSKTVPIVQSTAKSFMGHSFLYGFCQLLVPLFLVSTVKKAYNEIHKSRYPRKHSF